MMSNRKARRIAELERAFADVEKATESLDIVRMGYEIPDWVRGIDPDKLLQKYTSGLDLDEGAAQLLDHYLDAECIRAKRIIERERLEQHVPSLLFAQASYEHIGQIIAEAEAETEDKSTWRDHVPGFSRQADSRKDG